MNIKYLYYIIGFFILIYFDFLTKDLASRSLQNWWIDLINGFLLLDLKLNTWIAFSLPLEWLLLKCITIFLIITIIIYFLKYELKKNNTFIYISFVLILAWAIWNWYERIINGYVIDFISVKYFSVFNLADSYIFIWAIIYILASNKILINNK